MYKQRVYRSEASNQAFSVHSGNFLEKHPESRDKTPRLPQNLSIHIMQSKEKLTLQSYMQNKARQLSLTTPKQKIQGTNRNVRNRKNYPSEGCPGSLFLLFA